MIVLNKVDMTIHSLSTDRSDFTATRCGTNIQLRLSSSSEVGIIAVADDKIEGTEILMLQLVLTNATQTAVNVAGNIFIQDTLNIRVIDVTGNYKLMGMMISTVLSTIYGRHSIKNVLNFFTKNIAP